MQGIQSPVLSVIALAYFASIFASFESSQVAVLAVVVPVALNVELALPHTLPLLLLVLTVVAYSAVDEIHIAWQAGQLLRSAFHQDTPAEGRRIAEHVIASFSSCPIPEIARLAGP